MFTIIFYIFRVDDYLMLPIATENVHTYLYKHWNKDKFPLCLSISSVSSPVMAGLVTWLNSCLQMCAEVAVLLLITVRITSRCTVTEARESKSIFVIFRNVTMYIAVFISVPTIFQKRRLLLLLKNNLKSTKLQRHSSPIKAVDYENSYLSRW